MGQTLLHPEDPADPGLMFVIPAEKFERLDDWHGILGMRGSGSHSVRMTRRGFPSSTRSAPHMVDLPVEGGTVGSQLHGNPMYAGRTLGFFHGEFGAIMVGAAKAALDEHEHIITTRTATWMPTMGDHARSWGSARAARRERRPTPRKRPGSPATPAGAWSACRCSRHPGARRRRPPRSTPPASSRSRPTRRFPSRRAD